ncbi:sigma D regulator [Alteromonas sp. H39]|uniref:sigma D regulator n=1 Tax=Alteromonas sp. H39 TaxID=3389876 RepID=UPI0039E11E89
MLNKLEQAKDKWGGRHSTIDNWLHARQTLLIKYCELAGLSGGHDQAQQSNALPDATAIDAFCEAMMDYLSAGHFEVYDMLVSDDTEGKALKRRIYPEIAVTTDSALTFNDAYTDAVSAEQASKFDNDLAALGETLEARFELEDQLIEHMYHAEQALISEESAG